MAKKQVNLRSGSAYLWFFSAPIEDFSGFTLGSLPAVLSLPLIRVWDVSGGGRATNPSSVGGVDNNPNGIFGVDSPQLQGDSSQNQYPLITSITPEQQMSEATLSVERDNLDLKSQISSRATAYTSTGLDATVEVSIADITLRNLALAFGYQDSIEFSNFGVNTEAQRLHLLDNAGQFLDKFDFILIPAPARWSLNAGDNSEDLIKWRNSWVYIPQATVVDAKPNLSYGIEQQREIKMTLRSTPDFRKDDKPYQSSTNDRVIFGYPDPLS